jgi:hypothetical protein
MFTLSCTLWLLTTVYLTSRYNKQILSILLWALLDSSGRKVNLISLRRKSVLWRVIARSWLFREVTHQYADAMVVWTHAHLSLADCFVVTETQRKSSALPGISICGLRFVCRMCRIFYRTIFPSFFQPNPATVLSGPKYLYSPVAEWHIDRLITYECNQLTLRPHCKTLIICVVWSS